MADDIAQWLDKLGLSGYAQVFNQNGIGLDVLPHLSEDDLKELGLNLGDRRRLQAALKALPPVSPTAEVPAPTDQPEAERRQVTVLFADICGYTQLSTEMDAEEIHTTLGHFIDRADAIIHEHGGTVDKHIGDSVMAIFGAPVAHSDDSVRAVRAALAIHNAMPAISEQVGRKLQVHVGVASGQVVASGVGKDAHYTVTGESVNLASRLTDAAPPGETLMSTAVQHAVGQVVEWVPYGELTVKGYAAPIPAFTLKGLLMHAPVEARQSFVGRQSELRQFTGAIEACVEIGTGQAVLVRGEAGIGKTRLIEEYRRIATEHGFDSHRALILDFGVGKGQDTIQTLVRSLLDIPSASGKEIRAEAAERAFANDVLDRTQAVYLNDLLDLAQPPALHSLYEAIDAAARNQGKRETLAALVQSRSENQPALLIVEDLHWAEEFVVEQLAGLARAIEDCRAILLMTTRIEGDPLNQTWRLSTATTPLLSIDLRPLRQNDAMALAAEFFDANSQIALSCVKRADGNPLFLEQLLRNAGTMVEEQVPDSVQSIVQSRLDSLDALDKRAMQAASILGQRFSLDALRHLISNPQYTCDGLIEHYLVRPEGGDFLFAHALVQEGVYTSLLKPQRAALHREAATWFGKRDMVLRAEHLKRAGDPAAASAYHEAAEAVAAVLQFETALRLANFGIELVTDPDTKCDLVCLRADALNNLGKTDDSITAYETAIDSATDDLRRCRIWIGLAGGLRVVGRQKPALEILDKAEAVAAQQGFASELAQIHYLRGNVYFPLGNIEGCLAEHEKALVFAREADSAEGEALALGGLGDGYYLRAHMRTANEHFSACVELCREHGYGRIEVANRHMVGWTRVYLLEFAEAREDGLEARAMAATVSHRRAEMLGLTLAGLVELEMGNFAEARDHLDSGLQLARMMSAGNFEAQALAVSARLCAVQGKTDDARQLANQAVAIVREVGLTFIGPTVLAVLATLTKDPTERRAILKEAEDILDSGCVAHNHFSFANIVIEHALATEDWDETDRYATRLESYMQVQPLPWPEFVIARGRALSAWGRGDRSPELVTELNRLHDIAETADLRLAAPALEQGLAEARSA
jgi:class 3 adenylate cyclase/tetratricopeptide (TPR) repeat protein